MSDIQQIISQQGITLYDFLEESQVPQLSLQIQQLKTDITTTKGDVSRIANNQQYDQSRIEELYALSTTTSSTVTNLYNVVSSLNDEINKIPGLEEQIRQLQTIYGGFDLQISNIQNDVNNIKTSILSMGTSISKINDLEARTVLDEKSSWLKPGVVYVMVPTEKNRPAVWFRIVTNSTFVDTNFVVSEGSSSTTMTRSTNYFFKPKYHIGPLNIQQNTFRALTGTPYIVGGSAFVADDVEITIFPYKNE